MHVALEHAAIERVLAPGRIGEAPVLSDLLASWPNRFQLALSERMLARLGVLPRGERAGVREIRH